MKKIIISIVVSLASILSYAQGEFDALKYNQTDINGSARYMAMGGAFGALGGDASAATINPAGLGVFRSSEISVSAGVVNNIANATSTDPISNKNTSAQDNHYNVPLNNLSFILNFDTNKKSGLLSSTFGITFNKLKNFNRNVYIKGVTQNSSMTDYMEEFTDGIEFDDLKYVDTVDYEPLDYQPWLSILAFEADLIDTVTGTTNQWASLLNPGEVVNPTYSLSESGYINEWSFSYAANINNKIYLGAAIGVQSIDYKSTSEYSEDFASGGGFLLINELNTNGSGLNLKLGTILRPFNFLRIGGSISTPTIYSLTDTYQSYISSETTTDYSFETPIGASYYKLQGPFKCNGSLAFVIGKLGILSADYGFTNYTSMTLQDATGKSSSFSDENQGMNDYLQDTHSIKVGAEIKLNKNFAIRGGYGIITSATDKNARKTLPLNTTRADTEYFLDNNTTYMSGGLGYREGSWYFDLAYMRKDLSQDFYAYDLSGASKASVNTITNNFIATLGFKF